MRKHTLVRNLDNPEVYNIQEESLLWHLPSPPSPKTGTLEALLDIVLDFFVCLYPLNPFVSPCIPFALMPNIHVFTFVEMDSLYAYSFPFFCKPTVNYYGFLFKLTCTDKCILCITVVIHGMGTFETSLIILVLVDTQFVADFLPLQSLLMWKLFTPTCELLHEIFLHIDTWKEDIWLK